MGSESLPGWVNCRSHLKKIYRSPAMRQELNDLSLESASLVSFPNDNLSHSRALQWITWASFLPAIKVLTLNAPNVPTWPLHSLLSLFKDQWLFWVFFQFEFSHVFFTGIKFWSQEVTGSLWRTESVPQHPWLFHYSPERGPSHVFWFAFRFSFGGCSSSKSTLKATPTTTLLPMLAGSFWSEGSLLGIIRVFQAFIPRHEEQQILARALISLFLDLSSLVAWFLLEEAGTWGLVPFLPWTLSRIYWTTRGHCLIFCTVVKTRWENAKPGNEHSKYLPQICCRGILYLK